RCDRWPRPQRRPRDHQLVPLPHRRRLQLRLSPEQRRLRPGVSCAEAKVQHCLPERHDQAPEGGQRRCQQRRLVHERHHEQLCQPQLHREPVPLPEGQREDGRPRARRQPQLPGLPEPARLQAFCQLHGGVQGGQVHDGEV
ncbi:hypothetical protein BN1723_019861, partial [Verticillium longisporum]